VNRTRSLLVLLSLAAGLLVVRPAPAAPGDTSLVSVATGGAQGNDASNTCSGCLFFAANAKVSANGRYVAFDSAATNLVAGDTNAGRDIFVRDLVGGTTERVSVDSGGTQATGPSRSPAISADGRYVAFTSSATNLVLGDTNGQEDTFVRDRVAGTTARASVDSAGVQANASSTFPAISADGRHVAFGSGATNLVTGDTNAELDVFVRDLDTSVTERVSVSSSGAEGDDLSGFPAISGDGSIVVFQTRATTLAPGDTNLSYDILIRNRTAGTTTRAAQSSAGTMGSSDSENPSISADGRSIAFESSSSNLVPGDTNLAPDVFVHDRVTATTTRVSVTSAAAQAAGASTAGGISQDGRYVAFTSFAALVPGDTTGADVFVRDRKRGVTIKASWGAGGVNGNGASFYGTVSSSGLVVFESDASNLVAGDTNACIYNGVTKTAGHCPDVFAYEIDAAAASPAPTVVDCDAIGEDIEAIQDRIDTIGDGATLRLRGTCDLSLALPHGGDIVSVEAAAIVVRPGPFQFDGLTITSDGASQSARIVGSGPQAGFFIAPGNRNVTIGALTFANLGRPVVAVNTTGTTVGSAGGVVPDPNGNRIIGGAGMSSAILAIATDRSFGDATPTQQFSLDYGVAGGHSVTFPIPGGQALEDTKVLGNYITYDPVGVADGSTRDLVGIDFRQKGGGKIDGAEISRNAVGFLTSDFPSFNINAIRVHALAGDPNYHAFGVTIVGNNLGRLEELPEPVADVNAGGRAAIVLIRVKGFDINGNGLRTRLSPTGVPMPGGGIVTGDSSEGQIRNNGIIVVADPSTMNSDLGAIGVVDDLTAAFGSPPGSTPSDDIRVTGNIVGPTTSDTPGLGAQRGIVVNGSSNVVVAGNNVKFSTGPAVNIAAQVDGPGSIDSPGPISLPAKVTASTFCGNTLDGTVDDIAEVSFEGAGPSGSVGNSFPGGSTHPGNGECVTRAVVIEQTGGSTNVAEGGVSDTYTVRLSFRPDAPVTVTMSPDAQVTVSPASVSFTSDNWSVPQAVVVSAVDDSVAEGDHQGVIAHSVTSADAGYNGLATASVTVQITDNDFGGIAIVESGGSTQVAEGGATDTYTVALTTPPGSNVTITPNPGSQLTVSPTSLIFTPGNWFIPQTVTVTAVDDTIREGAHSATITHSSNHPSYSGAGVFVQIADNDLPARVIITNPAQNQRLGSTQVLVAGLAEAGATVRIYEGPLLGTTTASLNGRWSLVLTFSEGTHIITADQVATDTLVSPMSDPRTFVVDLTPPPAPIILRPAQDEQLSSSLVTIGGTAEAFAIVIVKEGGTPKCNARADSTGAWSCQATFGPGTHVVTAFAIDGAGNFGPDSAGRRFFVVGPDIPVIITPAEGAFVGRLVQISGTAPPGVNVRVYEGASTLDRIGVTTTTNTGSWSLSVNMSTGEHAITARSFLNGIESDASAVRTFTVDPVKPTIEITRPDTSLLGLIVIGELDNFRIDTAGTASDVGSGVVSVSVTVSDFLGGLLSPVLTDRSGTFPAQCTGCPGVSGQTVSWFHRFFALPGLYQVEVVATDRAGNVSDPDSVIVLKL
jgi:Tol biopolymer transport system component